MLKRGLNVVTGTCSFLLSIEAAEYLVSCNKEKRLKDKIFADYNTNDKIKILSYKPSYFYREFNIFRGLSKDGEIASIEKFKDLARQSYSLGRELTTLIHSIDKNLYDILYIVLKSKHINSNINSKVLTYNDKIKSDVTSMLANQHGIVIDTVDTFDNIDMIDSSLLSIVSNTNESQSFIKSMEEIGINDKYRVVPLNQVDTFCRNKFINIINNRDSKYDQKALAIRLIKERNKLVVDLSSEYADYFESILEQKDLVLLDLNNQIDEMNDLFNKVSLSVIFGLSSTILMDIFFYSGVSYNIHGLKDWVRMRLSDLKWPKPKLIGTLISNGNTTRIKLGIVPLMVAFALAPILMEKTNQFFKDILVPYINYISKNVDDDDDNDDGYKDDYDVVTSPIVVPGGTIHNPLSLMRLVIDCYTELFDEILFRAVLFGSLWRATNYISASIFSSIAYALYKDPCLDLNCTKNGWDEYSSIYYLFLKGLFLQGIYNATGWVWLPALISINQNLICKVDQFYSAERKELSTSHDVIDLYRKCLDDLIPLWRLKGFGYGKFVQPADNLNSNDNLTIGNDNVRTKLDDLSKQVMEKFNTINTKNNTNILSPIDLVSFMDAFHHALLVIKNKNGDDYQKELYQLLALNLVPPAYLSSDNGLSLSVVPFNDYNNLKKISINPFNELQNYYVKNYASHGMRQEEIRQYLLSKISHAGFKEVDTALLSAIEKEMFKWHNCDKNTYLDLMQLYFEGTLEGFDVTMKRFCKVEMESFFFNTAGRQVTAKDLTDVENKAFAFFKHANIGNLVKANSKTLQEIGISHHHFGALKLLRSKDNEVKKLFQDWETFFRGPLFYNRMKKIIKESFEESENNYNKNTKKATK